MELAGALAARSDVDLVLVARRADAPPVAVAGPLAPTWSPGPRTPAAPAGLGAAPAAGAAPDASTCRCTTDRTTPCPSGRRCPAVVTIHDLSFFDAPEWHERSKVLLFRRAIAVAARRAAAVVCPSRVTADAAGPVVPGGRRGVRGPPRRRHRALPTRRARPGADRRGLAAARRPTGRRAGRYLVFVGTLEPRKDVPTLVGAFGRIAAATPRPCWSWPAGPGWGADAVDAGRRRVRGRPTHRPDRVRARRGRPGPAAVGRGRRLPVALRGFGLPALEALACGSPLVTTSGTAMEEVAGTRPLLVDPGDVGRPGRRPRRRASPASDGPDRGRSGASPPGLRHRGRAHLGRPAPTGTWRPTGTPSDAGAGHREAMMVGRPEPVG